MKKNTTSSSVRSKDSFLKAKQNSKLAQTVLGISALAITACGRTVNPDEAGTNLVPTAFDDILRGSSKVDSITGLAGNDTIYGFEGNDQILAGDGDDIIYGGDGDDYIDPGQAPINIRRRWK